MDPSKTPGRMQSSSLLPYEREGYVKEAMTRLMG